MEDLKALTECAECTWDYIDRIRMALASACKERDELKKRLSAYEDTGLEPEQVLELKSFTQGGIHKIEDGWKHVQELLQAEQDGRLVVLPCKAGTLIYIGSRPAIITQFFGYVRERYFHAVFCDENKGIDIPFEELGKTVFLTREEAEAALKGGEG